MLPFKEVSWLPLVMAVEGLIGCGKTTLVRSLAAFWLFKAFFEPVKTNPYLSLFYKIVTPPTWKGRIEDAIRDILDGHESKHLITDIMKKLEDLGVTYSSVPAMMQLFLLTRRFHLYQAALIVDKFSDELGRPYRGALMDRSLPGDTVFARMLHEDGFINDVDMMCYWGHWQIMKEFAPEPHACLYLECSTETAVERIKSRGRDSEKGVPKEYLDRLESHYQDFLSEMSTKMKIIRYPYDPPKPIFDAREFPEFYPTLQALSEPEHRRVLHPDDTMKIANDIQAQIPKFAWFDRHAGHPGEMTGQDL